MGFDLNGREYRAFVDYMVKAIEEEEVVLNSFKKLIAKNDLNIENSKEIYDNKKEEIYTEQKIKELQHKNTKLEEELEQYKSENSEKIMELIEMEKTLQRKEIELENEIKNRSKLKLHISELENINVVREDEIKKLQENNYKLKNRFKREMDIFESYQNLSVSLRNSLSGIFRGNTVEEFIFCGVQKQNIELLWDAIRIRAIDENYSELEELNNIFCYFFYAYNKTFETPLYELQTVEDNEIFDNDKFLRTSSSNSSGQVTKVVLNGYINKNSNKIERKTIVKI